MINDYTPIFNIMCMPGSHNYVILATHVILFVWARYSLLLAKSDRNKKFVNCGKF